MSLSADSKPGKARRHFIFVVGKYSGLVTVIVHQLKLGVGRAETLPNRDTPQPEDRLAHLACMYVEHCSSRKQHLHEGKEVYRVDVKLL